MRCFSIHDFCCSKVISSGGINFMAFGVWRIFSANSASSTFAERNSTYLPTRLFVIIIASFLKNKSETVHFDYKLFYKNFIQNILLAFAEIFRSMNHSNIRIIFFNIGRRFFQFRAKKFIKSNCA